MCYRAPRSLSGKYTLVGFPYCFFCHWRKTINNLIRKLPLPCNHWSNIKPCSYYSSMIKFILLERCIQKSYHKAEIWSRCSQHRQDLAKKFPHIADHKRPKFIMADFRQNIPALTNIHSSFQYRFRYF